MFQDSAILTSMLEQTVPLNPSSFELFLSQKQEKKLFKEVLSGF